MRDILENTDAHHPEEGIEETELGDMSANILARVIQGENRILLTLLSTSPQLKFPLHVHVLESSIDVPYQDSATRVCYF